MLDLKSKIIIKRSKKMLKIKKLKINKFQKTSISLWMINYSKQANRDKITKLEKNIPKKKDSQK